MLLWHWGRGRGCPLRRGQNLRSSTPQNHRSILMSRPTKIFFFKFFFSKISLDRGLSDFSAILRHFYWQFPPFDFERPSWPQFCLKLGKIFSCMLELDKILDLNLIWIFFVRNFFHSEPRKIGLKTKNVYFFTVAHFWRVFYKNNVKLWWTFQVIFHFSHSQWKICHLVFENRNIFGFTVAKKLKF